MDALILCRVCCVETFGMNAESPTGTSSPHPITRKQPRDNSGIFFYFFLFFCWVSIFNFHFVSYFEVFKTFEATDYMHIIYVMPRLLYF